MLNREEKTGGGTHHEKKVRGNHLQNSIIAVQQENLSKQEAMGASQNSKPGGNFERISKQLSKTR